MGNVVLWKCASTAVYSAHYIAELFRLAGLPNGVITLLPSASSTVSEVAFKHPMFAGLHFTGSTEVFRNLWMSICGNLSSYHTYPRIVGETGGKDFIFVHKSANIDSVATAIIRGAFEFQGQKCSAASRTLYPVGDVAGSEEETISWNERCKDGTPRGLY